MLLPDIDDQKTPPKIAPKERLCHCCVLDAGGFGVLIKGASGSGKTSLMLGLIDRLNQIVFTPGNNMLEQKAVMVADDQALLSRHGDTLVAWVPKTLAGLVELYGFGIVKRPYLAQTQIGLIVQLVTDSEIDRMPAAKSHGLHGVQLPLIKVPARHEAQSVRIIIAWLEQNRVSNSVVGHSVMENGF